MHCIPSKKQIKEWKLIRGVNQEMGKQFIGNCYIGDETRSKSSVSESKSENLGIRQERFKQFGKLFGKQISGNGDAISN